MRTFLILDFSFLLIHFKFPVINIYFLTTIQIISKYRYLSISGRSYTHLIGQMEVIGDYSPDSRHVEWKTMEGLFVHPADFKAHHYEHTEL